MIEYQEHAPVLSTSTKAVEQQLQKQLPAIVVISKQVVLEEEYEFSMSEYG